MEGTSAIVLLSGGQDSTTCLAWALDRFDRVETLGIHYGQRHAVEMECRRQILQQIRDVNPQWRERLGEDFTVQLGFLSEIGATAMTRDIEIRIEKDGLPNTFVPGRNLLFVTTAAAYAYRRDIKHIVTGVCETDYSGYPDCRDDTMKALQVAINLGMQSRFVVHTPLMWRDKAETWALAQQLGGQALVDMILESTHTCYKGDREHRNSWGYGCDDCPACELRRKGYEAYASIRPA